MRTLLKNVITVFAFWEYITYVNQGSHVVGYTVSTGVLLILTFVIFALSENMADFKDKTSH